MRKTRIWLGVMVGTVAVLVAVALVWQPVAEPVSGLPAPPPMAPPPISVLPPEFEQQRTPSFRDLRSSEQRGPVQYGVNFISSAETPATSGQFANAAQTGATWDRWPLYWQGVEQSPGNFDWSRVDEAISAEIDLGYRLNLIFLGVPGFYWSGDRAVPSSLNAPVFSDGSDEPGEGKSINPDNAFARFVAAAVARYRPGGALAQSVGWPEGRGVSHWEMWNEPDLPFFWNGSKEEYARLLKVGYLAVKHVDPDAMVLFGGVANSFEPGVFDYYADVLALLSADSQAEATGYFHDIFATHSYFYSWQTFFHIDRARQAMAQYGLNHPIWLNESGVPAWDDYPGPVWESTSAFRATRSEQADYTIQSAFYAIAAGADAIFHFQLADGCGNQPAGTDFPPHNGELCDANGNLVTDPSKPCAGDAFGLFSNATDAACFTQHPQPNTARNNLSAYQVLTSVVGEAQPLWTQSSEAVEQVALYRPNRGERLVAVWARTDQPVSTQLAAVGNSARLVLPDGSEQVVTPEGGQYALDLPGATNRNYPFGDDVYAIGGRPVIVVEADAQAPAVTLDVTGVTTPSIALAWSGDDGLGSGLLDYTMGVSINDAAPTVWLTDTTQTSAVYTAELGQVVTFHLTARDRAGNVGSAEPVTIDFSGVYLRKSVDRDVAAPGATLVYTLTIGNSGALTPTLALTDTLPGFTTFITESLTTTLEAVAVAGGTLTWQGALAPGESGMIVFSVAVDDGLDEMALTRIVNRAVLTDGMGNRWEVSAETRVGQAIAILPVIIQERPTAAPAR